MLKFRIYPIAITADIEKVYLQISIDVLWYSDLSEEIISEYRFTWVIFGVTSSQFLLKGIVKSHGSKYQKEDPEFARKVKNHFYIDDLNTGVYSTEEGFEFYKKLKVQFLEASFNVRKVSNEWWRFLIVEYKWKFYNEKVLWIYWGHEKYIISLKINEVFKEAITIILTKQNILNVIASVCDPVGYLQSIVIKLKILFQKIRKSKIEWGGDIGILVNIWKEIVKV